MNKSFFTQLQSLVEDLPHHRLAEVARVIHFEPKSDYPLHSHKRIEINYVRKGECFIWMNDKRYHFRKGEMMVISSEQLHSFEAGIHGVTLLQLEFLPEVVSIFGVYAEKAGIHRLNNPIRLMRISHNQHIASIVQRIIQELSQKKQLYQEMVTMFYAELLIYLYRSQQDSNLSVDLHPTLKNVIDYIDKHRKKELRVGDIACKFGITERYLHKLFVKYLQISPLEYINRLKVAYAIELMQETDLTLKEISFQCGFSSPQQFSRIFKNQEGILPSEYRGF